MQNLNKTILLHHAKFK